MNPNRTVTAGAAALIVTALLGGCASDRPYQSSTIGQYPSGSQAYAVDYGVVDSIQLVRTGDSSGAGAVAGGVVGGVLGNQIGSGSGRSAATVAGAVGGALVGNELERRNKSQEIVQIGVRLDRGNYQTVMQDTAADLRVGDRVRVENGRVYRY